MWTSDKIASTAISLIGLTVAIASLFLSILTQNEQNKLRREIEHKILYSLISQLRLIDDFHDYMELLFQERQRVGARIVYNFYSDRINELTKIRSLPEYHLYLSVLNRPNRKMSQEVIRQDIVEKVRSELGYMTENTNEFLNKISGRPTFEVMAALETNFWWSLMNVSSKILEIADMNGNFSEDLFVNSDNLRERYGDEELLIMRATLNFEARAKVLFILLAENEAKIMDRLERKAIRP
jgi:hypothetical protein